MSKKKAYTLTQPTALAPSNTSLMLADNAMQSVSLNLSLDTNDLVALYVTEQNAMMGRKYDELTAKKQQLEAQKKEINSKDDGYDYGARFKKSEMGTVFIAECKAMLKALGHSWKDEMVKVSDYCTHTTTKCRMEFNADIARAAGKITAQLMATAYVEVEPDPLCIGVQLKAVDTQLAEVNAQLSGLKIPMAEKDQERKARAVITKLKLASMSGGKVDMRELITKLQEGLVPS